MRQFAEDEIVIPNGPYEGLRFRLDRQPFARLWFEAIDSGKWRRFVATGPSQSGKSFCCFVIPIMYHLFELGETVVVGIPKMDMASDKWRETILPVIEKSRYRALLPETGPGSRGGANVISIKFGNGATLRFMSGGGDDKTRASFTTRVVVITETDGMDEAAEKSREADPISQLEARTRSYGDRSRVYMECTVSTSKGRTWSEYQASTCSRIVRPCVHCKAMVTPDREHLVGWKDAENIVVAGKNSAFICPACGVCWSEADRHASNQSSQLVHRCETTGTQPEADSDGPATYTFGMRWSSADNLLITARLIGEAEWAATRSHDPDNDERALRQFWWALPYDSACEDISKVDRDAICSRLATDSRGVVPFDSQFVTIGADVQKYVIYWLAIAWKEHASSQVIDYGVIGLPTRELGYERAIDVGMSQLLDLTSKGWAKIGAAPAPAMTCWVDSGYHPELVHAFCRNQKGILPFRGYAENRHNTSRYTKPSATDKRIIHIGPDYHLIDMPNYGTVRADVNADVWKSWLHARLLVPMFQPGAMTLFSPVDRRNGFREHFNLAMHWTAEEQYQEFIPDKGSVTRWRQIRKENHWLDCGYAACAAAHYAGIRLTPEPDAGQPRRGRTKQARRNDGRGWWDR